MQRKKDTAQEKVIQAAPAARMVVEAPPGHGKTEVACARVAHLLAQGTSGNRILLLSFTRTAVREIRNRIAQLSDQVSARAVEVRTLDSFAWRVRTNFDETLPGAAGSAYEQNIRMAVAELDHPTDENVTEWLESFEHVMVDEAQDLVGVRAEMVVKLLNRLPDTCGWTVFMDPAQAIYGWAADEGGDGGDANHGFVDRIDELGGYDEVTLKTLYRTSDKDLIRVLRNGRNIVMERGPEYGRTARLREELLAIAGGGASPKEMIGLVRALGPEADETLILFRSRMDALMAAGFLANEQLPFRLRIGSMVAPVAPWIAATLNAIGEGEVTEVQFATAWEGLNAPLVTCGWTGEAAWAALLRMGKAHKSKRVDVGKVANRLAMATVPDELASKELGSGGPILGTIHSSKGREAPVVVLCIPKPGDHDEDEPLEEGRVLYVGITRAKRRLHCLKAADRRWGRVESGRRWRWNKSGVHVEIGRQGDIYSLGSLGVGNRAIAADALQARLAAPPVLPVRVDVKVAGRFQRHDLVEVATSQSIGTLERAVADDLQAIYQQAYHRVWKPNWIGHLWWVDVTTVALADNDARREHLKDEPYRTTGLWLAPVVVGAGYGRRPKGAG